MATTIPCIGPTPLDYASAPQEETIPPFDRVIAAFDLRRAPAAGLSVREKSA